MNYSNISTECILQVFNNCLSGATHKTNSCLKTSPPEDWKDCLNLKTGNLSEGNVEMLVEIKILK